MYFKLNAIFFVSLLCFASCSKTNPHFELKEKIVEKDLKTYDSFSASQDLGKSDEQEMIKVLQKIRQYRQANFDWRAFWVDTGEKIDPINISNEVSKNFFSLCKISCEEYPQSSYLIISVAEKGLRQHLKLGNNSALDWFTFFIQSAENCLLGEEDAFIFRYREILESILNLGTKEVKFLALNDLSSRLIRTRNSMLIKEMRELLKNNPGFLKINEKQNSLRELSLLADIFRKIFPFKKNIYLEEIVTVNPQLLEKFVQEDDFLESISFISKMTLPKDKISELTKSLISSWSQLKMISSRSEEERQSFFKLQLSIAEIFFDLLEKEFSPSSLNKGFLLSKTEQVLRKLERSFFLLQEREDIITQIGNEPLNFFLDLRNSKKNNRPLILESPSIEKISSLSDVLISFHKIHKKDDARFYIDLFCHWIGVKDAKEVDNYFFENGCHKIENTKSISIKQDVFSTALFSILKFNGNLKFESSHVDLSVIDLSATKKPEKSILIDSTKVAPVVFPLLLGFELVEDFLDLKKDKLYFFPFQFVFKEPLQGLAHDLKSENGFYGGDLILKIPKKSESFLPSFLSMGGPPADPQQGNFGGKSIVYRMDMYAIEEWLASSSQGQIYSLNVLSAKNLKRLFSKFKKNNINKIIIKIDKDYLNHIGDVPKSIFEESLKQARELGSFTSMDFFQEITSEALTSLAFEIDQKIQNGEGYKQIHFLNSWLDLPEGSLSAPQDVGEFGKNGSLIYE